MKTRGYSLTLLQGKTIYSYLRANGPTRVLCYTENKEKFFKEADTPEKNKGIEEIVQTIYNIELFGFGLSLINSKPQVIFFFLL